jgi:hypothetical protein
VQRQKVSKWYVSALGPLDGKDDDALVVEVGQGEVGIAKQFSA